MDPTRELSDEAVEGAQDAAPEQAPPQTLDLSAFRSAQFEARTETVYLTRYGSAVGVPNLGVVVRGLTADEGNKARTAPKQAEYAQQLAAAILSRDDQDAKKALAKLQGLGNEVAADTIQQIESVTFGIVEPAGWERRDSLKLANDFSEDFTRLYIAIMRLTGEGKRLAGSNQSGAASPAKTASP